MANFLSSRLVFNGMDLGIVLNKLKTAISFVKKHPLLFTLLLVLLLQFAPNNNGALPWGGIWMRMLVKDLPVADSAAASSVENYISSQIESVAKQQYPNLPEANRQKVVEDLKKKFRNENKKQLSKEASRVASEIRAHYSYESGGRSFLYMPDIDPYYYLRYARNIIEKGRVYDELKDGVPWDNHMIAPIGNNADKSWHPYILAFLFKIHSFFDKGTTLMESANYFPIVFILLSLVFAFLIAYRISGPVGGFFSATALAILPAIIGRTPWGHADTDAYTVFFPVLVVWLFFEALRSKSLKWQLIFGSLAGIAIGIYSNFWVGWWYLLDFIGVALIIAIVAEIVFGWKTTKSGIANWYNSNTKRFLLVGISVLISTAIICSLTIGFSTFFNSAFGAAISQTELKNAARADLWPNTLTTVAELNPGSLGAVINSVGGTLMLAFGIIGILFLLFRKDENNTRNIVYGILLAIWFAGTSYMSLKGIRFTILLGPAFAVAFGVAAGLLYRQFCLVGEKQLHISKTLTGIITILVFGLVMINPVNGVPMVKNAYNSVVNDVPIMNDAWWNTLTKIKEDSKPDAIINSWWDFGHHFKFVADRAVSFDGGTQTLPHAHWVGKVLQTDNEDEAIAILRMLDCGATKAYDVAFEKFDDSLRSIKFVKKIIMLDKESARKEIIGAGVSESILDFTHCTPPEDYFIASADMIGKSGVWSHFGLWNFEKAETWLKWKNLPESEAVAAMASRFNISDKSAKELYNTANSFSSQDEANAWISPWLGYITQEPASCSSEAGRLDCNKISINVSTNEARLELARGLILAGKFIVYDRSGKKNVFVSEGDQNLAIIAWPDSNGFNALASSSELADSMFTRLYFMGGLGLQHFRPFSSERQIIGGMIYVYKVDWNSSVPFVPSELLPKDSVVSGAGVSLYYIGWTEENGKEKIFDSTIADWQEKNISSASNFDGFENRQMSFIIGQNKVIPGFEKRILGMKSKETKTIVIPPEEAYGTDPLKHVLGNKTLHFKVKVEKLQ